MKGKFANICLMLFVATGEYHASLHGTEAWENNSNIIHREEFSKLNMAEPRSALFLSARRIQELVVLCLVLVSSTDGRKKQGKEGYRKQPRRSTCILLT